MSFGMDLTTWVWLDLPVHSRSTTYSVELHRECEPTNLPCRKRALEQLLSLCGKGVRSCPVCSSQTHAMYDQPAVRQQTPTGVKWHVRLR